MFKKDDLVIIKDDENTIVYVIIEISNDFVLLKGYTYRIIRKVNIDRIELASARQIEKETKEKERYIDFNKNQTRNSKKTILGTILHIDGDEEYLGSCMDFYQSMHIYAWGIYIKEKDIDGKILAILKELTPDIVVITGHDAYNGQGIKDLNNYENSKKYVDVVRTIRSSYSKDDLVVIVGACASHFEALIASGANFASSPARINIHTYDPAVVAAKVASTSCNKVINFESVIKHIKEGRDAFGGIETKGKMRILY